MNDMMIGSVLRASTEGFTCGTRSQEIEQPAFGAFVRSSHLTAGGSGDLTLIGLITAVRIDDDPLVRQLIMASNMNAAALRDQRENRLVPVEIDVLHIGYVQGGQLFYSMPPRPPLSLDPVYMCHPDEIIEFTRKMDFLRLVVTASGLPTVDLTAATIREAVRAYPPEKHREFLIQSGQYLAMLLNNDLATLRHTLELLKPLYGES